MKNMLSCTLRAAAILSLPVIVLLVILATNNGPLNLHVPNPDMAASPAWGR